MSPVAYQVESSVEKYTNHDGKTFWTASARAFSTNARVIEAIVQPVERIATVVHRGRVNIGEPWPDPTRPVGLARLLAIAESLAVTEWEKRYGGAK